MIAHSFERNSFEQNVDRRKTVRLIMDPPPVRIAFVGVGPKGLNCLERLAIELVHGKIEGPLEVHLFEPHLFPGAGPVYDPRQPSYLRVNFANRHIDMWSRGPGSLPIPRLTLVEWLQEHCPGLADEDGYAPRAVVGQYLHACFLDVVACLRSYVSVIWHQTRVEEIVQCSRSWKVRSASSRLIPSIDRTMDEVMIATGHASQRVGSDMPLHGRVIPAVFPVERYLSPERIPPGSTVALRGFWRTGLDAILALFEGRGGCFKPGDRLSDTTYLSSSEEVAKVLPFSRSGLPMVPKPDPRRVPPLPALDGIWREGAQRLFRLAVEPQEAMVASLREVVLATASRALEEAEGTAWDLEATLEGRSEGGTIPASWEAVERAMTASLEMAFGERPRTGEWALGEAWRKLYPGVVDLFAVGVLGSDHWPAFSKLARQMGRLAFGPPAENAARLLALVRAGKVDLSAVAGPRVLVKDDRVELKTSQGVHGADFLVNAVLAPPGAGPYRSSLVEGLLEHGHGQVLPNSFGVRIGADASCIGASGEATPGLAMVGRATEGSVLGNDTLSRTLHSQPTRWAGGLAGRLAEARERYSTSPLKGSGHLVGGSWDMGGTSRSGLRSEPFLA